MCVKHSLREHRPMADIAPLRSLYINIYVDVRDRSVSLISTISLSLKLENLFFLPKTYMYALSLSAYIYMYRYVYEIDTYL